MLLRVSYSCVFLGILGSGLALGACSSDGGSAGTGAAGTPTGTSGSGVGGGVVPQAGSSGATQGGSATAGSGTTVAGTSTGGMSGGAGGANGGAGGTSPGGAAGTGTGGGGTLPKMSAGCGKDNADDPTAWTKHVINVTVDPMFTDPGYKQRTYWTKPPKTYDKSKPIPLTMWGQGCGQTGGAENVPTNVMGAAVDSAVQVQFLAPANNHACYSAGPDGDNAKSPELPYFDAVLAETEANFCIDTSKVFMGGYSSGAWFTALISCNRTSVVRGVGFVAAGLQLNHDACTGPVAAIIARGVDDGGTPLAQTEAARDSLIMRNGCTTTTMPWDPGDATFDSSSCLAYQGCMPGYPVVYCPVPGGHTNGLDIGLSSKGFWHLWSTLP